MTGAFLFGIVVGFVLGLTAASMVVGYLCPGLVRKKKTLKIEKTSDGMKVQVINRKKNLSLSYRLLGRYLIDLHRWSMWRYSAGSWQERLARKILILWIGRKEYKEPVAPSVTKP